MSVTKLISIISRTKKFYESICSIFHADEWFVSSVNLSTLSAETLPTLETDLLLINIDSVIINDIITLLKKSDLTLLPFATACIVDSKSISQFNFLENAPNVFIFLKPFHNDVLYMQLKKMLYSSNLYTQNIRSRQQLEWKIREQSTSLDTTNQIAEYQSNFLDLILNSFPAGFIIIDTSDAIIRMNKIAETILCITYSESAGKSLWSCINDNTAYELKTSLNDLQNKPVDDFCTIKSKSGELGYYKINAKEFIDNDNIIKGKLIIFVNVTARVEANRLRNSFFTIISHELRTPLTIIYNTINLLKMNTLTPIQEQLLNDINEASDRSSELVTNILNMAYLNEVNIKAFYFKLDKIELINKLINQFKVKAQQKNIQLIVKDATEEKYLTTDPDLITMVLRNLLDNAIKYNRKNSYVLLDIYYEGELMCFSIKDEGEGFKTDTSEIFFQSFMQGESSLIRSHGGIGVGLYIAKRATDLLKGKIVFTSEYGVGSTFILKIPYSQKALTATN